MNQRICPRCGMTGCRNAADVGLSAAPSRIDPKIIGLTWNASISQPMAIITNRRGPLGHHALLMPLGTNLARIFATAASASKTEVDLEPMVRARWATAQQAVSEMYAKLQSEFTQEALPSWATPADTAAMLLSYTRVSATVRQMLGLPMDT